MASRTRKRRAALLRPLRHQAWFSVGVRQESLSETRDIGGFQEESPPSRPTMNVMRPLKEIEDPRAHDGANGA